MRLLCTITSKNPDEDPYAFSAFLKNEGIDNECEEISLPDELPIYRIWVIQEEHFSKAQTLYQEFHAHPQDVRFLRPINHLEQNESCSTNDKPPVSSSPYGKLTIGILLICILLFIWTQSKRPSSLVPPSIPSVIEAPVFSSIDQQLLFDYPQYFSLRDELLKVYTSEDIKTHIPPTQEAQTIMKSMLNTPFWNGIYDRLVNYLKNRSYPIAYHGPMFEKIGQGEIWRIFTPALMHFNLLHIFFNLLWFIVLGNQIEFRIGFFKYLILILATAIISNIAQYLMSGSFFMGLSGVVVGLVGFIYARQQKAFWEGYLLNKMTFIFLFAFIFGMFALQLAFFFVQIFTKHSVVIAIANTAHIIGGLVGYLLGRMNFFSIKNPKTAKM